MHQSYSHKTNISDWLSPCESSSPLEGCHISQYGLFAAQGSFQQLPYNIVQHPSSNQIGFAFGSPTLLSANTCEIIPAQICHSGYSGVHIQKLWNFNITPSLRLSESSHSHWHCCSCHTQHTVRTVEEWYFNLVLTTVIDYLHVRRTGPEKESCVILYEHHWPHLTS